MGGKVTLCVLITLAIVLSTFAFTPYLMAQDDELFEDDELVDEPTLTEETEAKAEETTETAAEESSGNERTMWQLIKESFPVGLVIILLSVVTIALAVEHFVSLQRDKLIPPELLQDIEELFEEENYEDVMETCAAEPGYLTNVIGAALPRVKTGFDSMMEAVHAVSEEEAVKLQQKISWLQLIGAIAPMLGLLGTVTGMITAFNKIAEMTGPVKPKDLAGGIRQALVTTVMGLVVAIIAIPCYFYFRNKVVRISMEIAGVAEELLDRFRGRA